MRRISARASAAERRRLHQRRPNLRRKCHRSVRQTGTVPAAQSHTDPVPPRDARPKPKAQARPYANSRPVKRAKAPSARKRKADGPRRRGSVRGSYLKNFPALGLEQNEVFLLGIEKYRVHEVAKDFGLPTKTITEILTKYAETPKNHMQALTDQEPL